MKAIGNSMAAKAILAAAIIARGPAVEAAPALWPETGSAEAQVEAAQPIMEEADPKANPDQPAEEPPSKGLKKKGSPGSGTSLVGTGFLINKPGHPLQFKAFLEMGFVAPLDHRIKFSKSGTYFDYVKEGNQDNLFFFWRVSAEMEIVRHHSIIFLYQPLTIETRAPMRRDVTVDDLTFPEGTPVDLLYGFDFFRFSYLYDIFKDPGIELSIGLSLQIRNASIAFTSVDGTLHRSRNNIGPVPLLKIRVKYTFKPGVFIGTELDGWWASGKYMSGSSKDFDAAILDASLRVGFDLTEWADVFVNLRYLGGGARGKGSTDGGPGDGFTRNWIHLLTFSIGVGLG